MAKRKILQDQSGQVLPVTNSECVYLVDGKTQLSDLIENINYSNLIAFDTSEIIIEDNEQSDN